MTITQQAKYGVCREGWHRFDFKLYLKVRSEKLSRELKQQAELLGIYKRPQTNNNN